MPMTATAKRTRRRSSKQIVKRQEEFNAAIRRTLGAEFGVAAPDRFGAYHLPTPLGTLAIHLDEPVPTEVDMLSVFRRFDDVATARIALPESELNHHSGKWNFHWTAATMSVEAAAGTFADELRRVLSMRLIPNAHYLHACLATFHAPYRPLGCYEPALRAVLEAVGCADVHTVDDTRRLRLFWTPARAW